jgi:hypothetical protein
MVVAVVTPVVLCAKATEKRNKTLKLVVCYQKVYLEQYIVKHIVIPISLIVACRARGRSPNHFGSDPARHIGYRRMESWCHCEND